MGKKIRQPKTFYIGSDDGLTEEYLIECSEDASISSVGIIPDSYISREIVGLFSSRIMALLREINRLKKKCNEKEISYPKS